MDSKKSINLELAKKVKGMSSKLIAAKQATRLFLQFVVFFLLIISCVTCDGTDWVATKLTRSAAELGYPAAQYSLGYMYYKGEGVPQNYDKAAKWFRRAADQGHPEAQYVLGRMYHRGEGVPQNYVEAHKWLNLAVALLEDSSFIPRDRAMEYRDRVAIFLSPEQLAQANRLAEEWYSLHIKKNEDRGAHK